MSLLSVCLCPVSAKIGMAGQINIVFFSGNVKFLSFVSIHWILIQFSQSIVLIGSVQIPKWV